MKKISIVFAFALFLFSCNEKKDTTANNNNLLEDNLKGAVKQVTETPYKTDSTGKIGAMDSCCIETVEYDSAGYVTHVTRKDSKGNIKFEQTLVHYDNGMFKEFTNKDSSGRVTERITIQLDKDGKNYASAQQYDTSAKVSMTFKDFSQNEYNQPTAMKGYKNDSLKFSEETKYSNHLRTEQTNKDSSGGVTFHVTNKLDDKGNETEITRTSTMKDPKTKKDTTKTTTVKYRYDSFDDNGNWTQRTEMDEKGKPSKIEKREIVYYNKQ